METKKSGSIVLFNIPPALHKSIRQACRSGLKHARQELCVKDTVEILVLYDPSELSENPSYRSRAGGMSKNALYVNINAKKQLTAKALRGLESTIAHEYLHCLRWNIRIATVLDNFINEGLSCYLQSYLYEEPEYLDIEGTRIEHLRKWWRWWRSPYLYKPFTSVSSSNFLSHRPTREAGYRIGYYIVTSFLDAHPQVTLRDFPTIRYKRIHDFARSLFNK
ncbi:hypothetical protein HYV71_02795 [Candidatus Uhrbacteria bacterium]|nr:hypothetical protein [Candidatus Uhrbacteria bacterium]